MTRCVDCNQPITPDATAVRGFTHEGGRVSCRGGFGSAWPATTTETRRQLASLLSQPSRRRPRFRRPRYSTAATLAAAAVLTAWCAALVVWTVPAIIAAALVALVGLVRNEVK